MKPSYKDFKQKFILDNYDYSLTLDIDYQYANLWLANINLNKHRNIYLPFKYFDVRLYFVMSTVNSYRKWKSNE